MKLTYRCCWMLVALTGTVALAQTDVLSPSEGGGILDRPGVLNPSDRLKLNDQFILRNSDVISKRLNADSTIVRQAYDRVWASGVHLSPLDFLATHIALRQSIVAVRNADPAFAQSLESLIAAAPEDLRKLSAEVSDRVSTLLIDHHDPVRSLQWMNLTKPQAKKEIQAAKEQLKAAGLR